MNYIGSKLSLLPFLEKNILEFSGVGPGGRFFDIFAGTSAVGRRFKALGCRIVANDIQYYSYCLNRAYVGINAAPEFRALIGRLSPDAGGASEDPVAVVLQWLNRLSGLQGFIYRHYCPGGTAGTRFPRLYFTDENGKRCDAIRTQIEVWRCAGLLSDDEYFYLLAVLLEAVDRVANTASVYGAFLKHVKRSAAAPLRLERLGVIPSGASHEVYNCNGLELVGRVPCDVLYIDPPYNQRQYCTNYHVLETIARYDEPELYGATGLRAYGDQKSDFCSRAKALWALEHLIRSTSARCVFLSYNSEGLMSEEEILAVMRRYGVVVLQKAEHRRFRADVDGERRRYRADDVTEYLFCLRKSD